MGSMVDITERKHLEEALRSLSLTDELTGLYNRRGFSTLAERHLSIARRKGQDLLAGPGRHRRPEAGQRHLRPRGGGSGGDRRRQPC